MVVGTINITPGLKGHISAKEQVKGRISAEQPLKGRLSSGYIPYIPSNYGLITWDGSVMTVS